MRKGMKYETISILCPGATTSLNAGKKKRGKYYAKTVSIGTILT
jgi:hypothetical protein